MPTATLPALTRPAPSARLASVSPSLLALELYAAIEAGDHTALRAPRIPTVAS